MAGAYYPFSHRYADLPFIAWRWSLAYTIVYFILGLVLIVRIVRRTRKMAVYVCLVLVCAARVTTFVLRVVVPWHCSDASSGARLPFPHHLMAGSVAFVPLAIACLFAAVMLLTVRWHNVATALQIYAPRSENSITRSGALGVGIVSGALFIIVCTWLLVCAARFAIVKAAPGQRTAPGLVVVGATALVLQSVGFLLWVIADEDQMYNGTQFGTTPEGVLVLTALPDFVVLALFAVVDLDDLKHVTWFPRRKRNPAEDAVANAAASAAVVALAVASTRVLEAAVDEEMGHSASPVKAST